MSRTIRFPPCSIVCHDLCEVKIAEHLRSKLRIGIRSFSKNGGKNSLEVQNIPIQLAGIPGMKDASSFCRIYGLSKNENAPFLSQHRIFFLMDRDAADRKTWSAYKEGSLFHNLWVAPYAVPIFFEPDLDTLSSLAGYPIDKKSHKPDQIQKFLSHPNKNYLGDIASLSSHTNLSLLLDYLRSQGFSI